MRSGQVQFLVHCYIAAGESGCAIDQQNTDLKSVAQYTAEPLVMPEDEVMLTATSSHACFNHAAPVRWSAQALSLHTQADPFTQPENRPMCHSNSNAGAPSFERECEMSL